MKEYNELKDVIKLCKDDPNIYANLDLVDLKELKELLEEVEYLRSQVPNRKNNIENKWLIEKKDNLALCYKTFLGKEAGEKDLEICAFNTGGTRYTIASFEYNDKDGFYYLQTCGNFTFDYKNIDWEVFGLLVQKAYKILEG